MKKRTLLAAGAFLVLSLGIALGVKKTSMNQNPWSENVEALCSSENTVCLLDGGPGHKTCTSDAALGGVGCSVCCTAGWACCTNTGCFCIL